MQNSTSYSAEPINREATTGDITVNSVSVKADGGTFTLIAHVTSDKPKGAEAC